MIWKTNLKRFLSLALFSQLTSSVVASNSSVDDSVLSKISNAKSSPLTNIIPNKYIVEYSDSLASLSKRSDSDADNEFYQTLTDNGIDASANYNLSSDLFQGTSLTVSSNTSLDDIKKLDQVKEVWPVQVVFLNSSSVVLANNATWNPHAVTGVDKLHDRSIYGKDVTIAIIDTGVQYTHPALGGGIGDGYKIEYGYDLVGDDWVYTDDEVNPDDDPMDCLGHGTHVAGIIGANAPGWDGVAPNATIRSYKIFGCSDGTTTEQLMAAFEMAYNEGADIITASVGGSGGFSDFPWAKMASGIVEKGVFVSIAAGNGGEYGPYYPSNGAAGDYVTAVASVEAEQLITWTATLKSSSGDSYEFDYITQDGTAWEAEGSYQLSVTSTEACFYSGEKSSANATVILAKRGTCVIQTQYNDLMGYGFKFALLYNSYGQSMNYLSNLGEYYFNGDIQGMGLVDKEVGTWAVEEINNGNTIVIEFGDKSTPYSRSANLEGSGKMDYFSSWGNTYEHHFYPTIAAPGGDIYSTYPTNEYAILSGTSMATPYIAGVAALYFNAKGGRSNLGTSAAVDLRTKLISTANSLQEYDYGNDITNNRSAPLIQQGSGLVNAIKLIDYNTSVTSEGAISLNDTRYRVDEHTITIKNNGEETVTYNVSHTGFATVQVFANQIFNTYYPPVDDVYATVSLSQTKLSIPAGGEGSINVTITAPSSIDESLGPVFQGKIVFTGSNDELVSVPYVGAQFDTSTDRVWGTYFRPLFYYYNQNDGYLYGLDDLPDKSYNLTSGDSPRAYFIEPWGTKELSIDIVYEDWNTSDFKYPISENNENYLGPLRSYPYALDGSYTDFPLTYYSRSLNSYSYIRPYTLANGTEIKDGNYRMLVRHLKPFGVSSNIDDWEFGLSESFIVGAGSGSSSNSSSTTITSSSTTSTIAISSARISSSTYVPSSFTTSYVSSSVSSSIILSSTVISSNASPTSTVISSAYTTSLPVETNKPDGLSGIVNNVRIKDSVTEETSSSNPKNKILVEIDLNIPNTVIEGDTTVIYFPKSITDLPKIIIEDGNENHIATTSFNSDNSTLTFTYTNYMSWHNGVSGTLSFTANLKNNTSSEYQPGPYQFEFITNPTTFYPTYEFVKMSQDEPTMTTEIVSGVGAYIYIDMPGSLNWTTFTVTTTYSESYFAMDCDSKEVLVSDSLDVFGYPNSTTAASTSDYSISCAIRKLTFKYNGDAIDGEVVRFKITDFDSVSYNGNYGNTFVITVTGQDGVVSTYSIYQQVYKITRIINQQLY